MRVAAVSAKIQSWFPLTDGEDLKSWLFLPRPDSGQTATRFPHRVKITVDNGGAGWVEYDEVFIHVLVRLGWFPSGSAEGVWHSNELVKYWDSKTGGQQIYRDSFVPKRLFTHKGQGVYEATVWFAGDWTPKPPEDIPEGASYIIPTAVVGFKLVAFGKSQNFYQTVATSSDTLLKVDLDIDSDNNNGSGPPDRSPAEEALEDDGEKTGKLIGANNGDRDFDNIPDYADGFDGETLTGVEFTELVVEIPDGIETDKLRVKLLYSASDPAAISVTNQASGASQNGDGSDSSWTTRGGKIYGLPTGNLRLWLKDASESRKSASVLSDGDFIPSDTVIPFDKIIGGGDERTVTLFAEGVKPTADFAGDEIIALEFGVVGSDGGVSSLIQVDEVRSTVVGVAFRDFSGADLALDLYSHGSGDFGYNSSYQNAASLPLVSVDSDGSLNIGSRILPTEHGIMDHAANFYAGRGNGSEPIPDVNLFPEVSQTVDQLITVSSGGEEGFTVLDSIPGVSEEEPSVRSGMVGLAFFKKITRTVGIRRVNQRYGGNLSVNDFDAPEFTENHRIALENYLNNAYRQANIEWSVEIISPPLELDYDDEVRNQLLDPGPSATYPSIGYEHYEIEDYPGQNYDEFDYVVFLVDGILWDGTHNASGFAKLGGGVCIHWQLVGWSGRYEDHRARARTLYGTKTSFR